MTTVNSISGGRTSSFIAAHYPADVDIFSLVCIDCHNAGGQIDKHLKQLANDRLQKTSSHWPEFRATSEDPIILKTIFELEQHIGREIVWVRGMSWEQMIAIKKALPNRAKRFCSFLMKILPIFEYLYMRHPMPVKMRIGYRYDEMERADDFTDTIKFAKSCQPARTKKGFIHRWEELAWRTGDFPLIDDRIMHHQVNEYWKPFDVPFADDSNCQNCFWKQPQQLRKNLETNPQIMKWSAVQESIAGHTFKDDHSLLQIFEMGIQLDFHFGTGSGCQAGFCTD